VQIVPAGVDRLVVLRQDVADRRDILLVYCGEGYSSRQETSRSMLGAAHVTATAVTETAEAHRDNMAWRRVHRETKVLFV
jgi:hypothetical protein